MRQVSSKSSRKVQKAEKTVQELFTKTVERFRGLASGPVAGSQQQRPSGGLAGGPVSAEVTVHVRLGQKLTVTTKKFWWRFYVETMLMLTDKVLKIR